MKKEIIINARSAEEAVAQGAQMLGVDAEKVEYEIIEDAKKGFLGVGTSLAKVKIYCEQKPEEAAFEFVKTLIADMGLEANAELKLTDEGNPLINIWGGNAGALIGHHGDTLDALQYLVNLTAVRDGGSGYAKITVDVEHYRAKREDTLRRLARRTAAKALKYHKSITLEPMNPYERRIIHSEIQHVEGVTTSSVGTDNNRKVVVYLEGQPAHVDDGAKPERKRSRRGRKNNNHASKQSAAPVVERDDTYYPEDDDLDYSDAPTTYVHAPTPRPEKLKSIASYFGDDSEDDGKPVEEKEHDLFDLSYLAKAPDED